MSLADWTISAGGATAGVVTSGVIEGSKSFRMIPVGAFESFSPTRKPTAAFITSGANVTTGRIRTLAKATAATGEISIALIGVVQSSLSVNSQSYQMWIRNNLSGGTSLTTVVICKNNLGPDTPATLSSTGISAIPFGTVFAAEFEWQRDSVTGLYLLTARTGLQTDFSDLAVRTQAVDDSSPFTSGISMGIGCRSSSNNGQSATAYFDIGTGFKV